MPPNAARRRRRARGRRRRLARVADGRAARVGVLDDRPPPARRIRARCAPPRRDRAGSCTRAPCPAGRRAPPRPALRPIGIPGGPLMRVFAVAQVADLVAARATSVIGAERHPAGASRIGTSPSLTSTVCERRRDRGVVGAGVRERLARQLEAERREARRRSSCGQHARVVGRDTTTSTSAKVLGGGAHQRGPPMSISSTSASNGVAGFAAAFTNGYRLTTTRSTRPMPCASSAVEIVGRDRAARGCRRESPGAAS